MRHGRKVNHLGRTSAHRKALLTNLAIALITHKKIETTVAKAKALRVYIEPLLTRSKLDTMTNRRLVFAYLSNKEAVSELYRAIAPKIMDRKGGYTRVIKLGTRQGDGAEMALIELVDFSLVGTAATAPATEKKKTTRRAGKKNTEKIAEVTAE